MNVKPTAAGEIPEPRVVDRITASDLDPLKLNVVVFGPGEGEGVVVLLPDGRVGVVDGCAESNDAGDGDPVLDLVRELVDGPTPRRLAFACLTHPHSDHFRGLGRLVERYASRIDHVCLVNIPMERSREAILEWVRAEEDGDTHRAIDRLYAALYSATNGPCDLGEGVAVGPRGRPGGHMLEMRAVGPSRVARGAAMMSLVRWGEARKKKGTPLPAVDPNGMSGALLIEWGEARVLLAGDLLREGWGSARRWLSGRVQVVNVAHHASEEAHDDALWAEMNPKIAIVTPFKHAAQDPKRYPPTPMDVKRLATTSCKVAITSPPQWLGRSAANPRASRKEIKAARTPSRAPRGAIPKDSPNAKRNAVAVTLHHDGSIERVVFGGDAAWYE